MTADRTVDVAVVGAGLAGLAAARRLEADGLEVIVLEGAHEVGGRVRSRTIAGEDVDLGAEFVGAGHQRVARLANELGLRLDPTGLASSPVLWRLSVGRRVGRLPPVPIADLAALGRVGFRASRLARDVDEAEPWRSPRAAELDAESVASWLDAAGLGPGGYEVLAAIVGSFATVSLDRISLLQFLWWLRRAGGVVRAARSGEEYRIEGGTQQLAIRTAGALRGAVRLGARVTAVTQATGEVAVQIDGMTPVRARRALVCVPIPVVPDLRFEPPLPGALRALHDELRFGAIAKAAVVPPGPPTSEALSTVGCEPLIAAWRRGRALTGLAVGAAVGAGKLSAMLDCLSDAFATPLAGAPVDFVDWTAEPLIRGSYLICAPGQLTRHGPNLRQPYERVHFAGAGRSTWPDSMEGALESGALVAEEVSRLIRAERR